MTTLNDFKEYYKTISDIELLDILENQENYQQLAVEAAKNEFANRQLSDAEVSKVKDELLEKKLQKQKRVDKTKAIEAKIKNSANALVDTVNPTQSETPTTDKIIKLVSFVYGGLFLFQFIKDFNSILGYITDIPSFPMLSLSYLAPLILMPIATFNFYKRKSTGWILLAILVTYLAVSVLWILLDSFSWKPSGFNGLDTLFPRPSTTTCIIQLIFLIGTLYIICKTNIRETFKMGQFEADNMGQFQSE